MRPCSAVNATTGVLTFNTAPDYETPTDANTDGVYEVTVQVDDGQRRPGHASPQRHGDRCQRCPGGHLATAAARRRQSQCGKRTRPAVTTVTATDADVPADTLTFTITGGADAALFTVNATTGVLTFNTAPDYETTTDANTDGVYEVTVQVDDGNGGLDSQAISVSPSPTANDAPVVTSDGGGPTAANLNAPENQTSVTTVTATDARRARGHPDL